jgi:hypothetical protein
MKYNRDIGLVSRQTETFICMLLAAVLILAIAYALYNGEHAIMESFQRNPRNQGKLMFNGSYPSPPVVCLAGNSKIPCTAFSSG